MTDKIKEQIMAIRDSGKANMFDTKAVQYFANERDFYELVIFIEERPSDYLHFITTGRD